MKKINIETFIPGLLKTVQRNKGILDIWEAKRIFSPELVALALKKEVVRRRVIILNGNPPIRIECITYDWDGKKPAWLEKYKKGVKC